MTHIREATDGDLQPIIDFQRAMAAETEGIELDREKVSAGVKNALCDRDKGIYFVAETKKEVIGSLLITFEWSDWRNGTIWWFQSVYVKPAYRGKGVFRRLFDHVKSITEKDPEIVGLRLYVHTSNTRAQKIYTHLGMDGASYQVFELMA